MYPMMKGLMTRKYVPFLLLSSEACILTDKSPLAEFEAVSIERLGGFKSYTSVL